MILYLHGLNSSGASAKAVRLREGLPSVEVLSPTYPAHRPNDAVAELERLLGGLDPSRLVVVGSSMGGFYGQYLAGRFPFGHLVLINPALTPWSLLPDHLGEQYNSATGERYQLTAEMAEKTRLYDGAPPRHRAPTTLLIDRGDELIDWRIAQGLYAGRGELRLFEGGSHAFDHMAEATPLIGAIHAQLQ